jgi:hypothetical protein
MRKNARETMNLLPTQPISTASDSAIQEVGKLLTGKESEPTKPYVILGEGHPLREGQARFILCPTYAKQNAETSSLSALDTDEARLFHKALQNLGRFAPAVDGAGKSMDLLAAAPWDRSSDARESLVQPGYWSHFRPRDGETSKNGPSTGNDCPSRL